MSAPEPHTGALAGRHVVVTRPRDQAASLCRTIEAEDGIPVLFPVLAIFPLEDPTPVLRAAERLDGYYYAIFVSANAIEQALSLILERRPWPAHVRVAAIGKSSEKALARFGIRDVIAPTERFDSEALLDLPPLREVAGRRIAVFRGDAGRELLGDTLQQRGATVDYVPCYRRTKPDVPPTPLLDLWQKGALDALTLTSSEGLRNLHDMLDAAGRAHLVHTSVFVPHQRIAEEARRLGLTRVMLTPPGDEGLVSGLKEHFASSGPA